MHVLRAAATVAVLAVSIPIAAAAAAAENPFVGRWKLDLEKSKFTGDTMTFDDAGGGKMKLTAAGRSYTFTPGKKTKTPFGWDATWKKVDDRTWEVTSRTNGSVAWVERMELGDDGKTLHYTAKGKRPDGSSFEDASTYERVSGDKGLVGKWRSTKADVAGFRSMEIAENGKDGLALTLPDFGSGTRAKLDGKDYPWKGPQTPKGYTLALKKGGDRKVDLVQKKDGKPIFQGSLSLSDDGKVLTWDWTPVGAEDEKIVGVFERQ